MSEANPNKPARLPDSEISVIRFYPAVQIDNRSINSLELRDGRGRTIPGHTVEVDRRGSRLFVRTEKREGVWSLTEVPLDMAIINYRMQGVQEADAEPEAFDAPSPNMADRLPPPQTIAQRRA